MLVRPQPVPYVNNRPGGGKVYATVLKTVGRLLPCQFESGLGHKNKQEVFMTHKELLYHLQMR
jgi:hypothetical protein